MRELFGGHGLGASGEGRDQVHRERREAHAAEHLGVWVDSGSQSAVLGPYMYTRVGVGVGVINIDENAPRRRTSRRS